MEIFSIRLKELRIEKRLTQPQLAKILNVSNGIISGWENGIYEPKISYLKEIADYFGVCADYLIGRQDWY